MVTYVVAIVAVAFVFDFINGFHDSANSIATVVGTRVLSPIAAVIWAAFFNFMAAFTVGTAVAKTVGSGMIDIAVVDPNVILAGLLGAIIWNLITWFYGLPSSSSHALIGGYAGAAVAKAGFAAIIPSGWTKTLIFIVLSPLIGMLLGYFLMVAVYWLFQRSSPHKVDSVFRRHSSCRPRSSRCHMARTTRRDDGIMWACSCRPAYSRRRRESEASLSRTRIPPSGSSGAYTAIALGTCSELADRATMGSRSRSCDQWAVLAETAARSAFSSRRGSASQSAPAHITGAIVGVGATPGSPPSVGVAGA